MQLRKESLKKKALLDIVNISKIPHVAYFGNYKLKLT